MTEFSKFPAWRDELAADLAAAKDRQVEVAAEIDRLATVLPHLRAEFAALQLGLGAIEAAGHRRRATAIAMRAENQRAELKRDEDALVNARRRHDAGLETIRELELALKQLGVVLPDVATEMRGTNDAEAVASTE